MALVDPELILAVSQQVESARLESTPEAINVRGLIDIQAQRSIVAETQPRFHPPCSFISLQNAEDIVKDATDPNEVAEAASAAQTSPKTGASPALPVFSSAIANNPDGVLQLAKLLSFSKVKKERRRGIAIFHQVFASGESNRRVRGAEMPQDARGCRAAVVTLVHLRPSCRLQLFVCKVLGSNGPLGKWRISQRSCSD
jgi:hypothetical protein